MAMQAAGMGGPMCRHWAEGKCNFGDQCRFSHVGGGMSQAVQVPAGVAQTAAAAVGPQIDANALAALGIDMNVLVQQAFGQVTQQLMNSGLSSAAEALAGGAGAGYAPAPAPSRGVVVPVPSMGIGGPPKTSLCRHWMEGRCNYGDQCRFSHDGPGGSNPLNMMTGGPGPGVDAGGKGGMRSLSYCKQFLQNGSCVFGEQCRFSHDVDPAAAPGVYAAFASAPGGKGGPGSICQHFLRGRCTYGDQCRFTHTATEVEVMQDTGEVPDELLSTVFTTEEMGGFAPIASEPIGFRRPSPY